LEGLAYTFGQVLYRTPSLGFFLAGIGSGGNALLNYFDVKGAEKGLVVRDLSELKDRSYVVLTGKLKVESCNSIRDRGLPGVIGDLQITKTVTTVKVVTSTFRADVSREDPRFRYKAETHPPEGDSVTTRYQSSRYTLVMDSGETVFLEHMNDIQIDGESLTLSSDEELYNRFYNCHEFSRLFEGGNRENIVYRGQYNFVPDNATVTIAGDLIKDSDGYFTLSKPLDSNPYLVTTKKIEEYLSEKNAKAYFFGLTSIAFLGLSAYLKWRR